MSSPNEDWYGHLVGQSRNNNIYTLIHQFLEPDWAPNHDYDFVVVRRDQLPGSLQEVPANHLSKKLPQDQYRFLHRQYIVLHNYKLTEYLYHAKWARIIEDEEGNEFIELCYVWTDEAENIWHNPPAYPMSHQQAPQQTTKLPVTSEDFPLFMAYELLQSGTAKEQALAFAQQGEAFLDAQHVDVGAGTDVTEQIFRRMKGYNIVAMVYAWNNLINKAAEVDQLYIHHPVMWPLLNDYIKPYLEMLMVEKQQDYLDYLFSDLDFRNYFLAHYEAYISLLVDDTFELTRMAEVVNIINRVNNTPSAYK